jgi:hypothetical protein
VVNLLYEFCQRQRQIVEAYSGHAPYWVAGDGFGFGKRSAVAEWHQGQWLTPDGRGRQGGLITTLDKHWQFLGSEKRLPEDNDKARRICCFPHGKTVTN